jgi:hypothetical protein
MQTGMLRRPATLKRHIAAVAAAFFCAWLMPTQAWSHDIYIGVYGKSGQLCCGGEDCSATLYRERAGSFEFLTRENVWISIPQERISFLPVPGDPRSNEGRRAHLCYRAATDDDHTTPASSNVFGRIFLHCVFISPGAI